MAAAASMMMAAAWAWAAAPVKTLHYILPAAEASFDPALGRDLYTGHITEAIFETLYTYDYLARPVQLAPETAAALPEVAADGKTYLIRLKPGTYFTPDPAFHGQPRELTVADYVYAWKRLFDPRLASPNAWLLEGKVLGLDALAEQARQTGRFNYDAPVAGLEIIDPYTLRIHLTRTDFNLGMILAYAPLAAVAREVVDLYGDSKGEVAGHPVGTGVYKLGQWIRGSRIVLEENTGHRAEVWDFHGDAVIERQMKGKKIPQIGRIEISVQLEDQSRWLSFTSGEADLFWLDGPLAPKALVDGKLRPELAERGIQLSRIVDPGLSYYYWNMRDPVVGGFSKEKIALRCAAPSPWRTMWTRKSAWCTTAKRSV
ncbi:ABC transporter substrate-binding protein [Duganella sacchari]|nr:ABC transporter substrate-binding protein [Duganella sacchari]